MEQIHGQKSAYHVEGRFRKGIVGTRENLLERANGVLEGDKLAFKASEDLGNLERLRHETLNLTRTLHLKFRLVTNTTT